VLDVTRRRGKTAAVRSVLAISACGPRLELALLSAGAAAPGLVALSGPTPRSELVMAGVDLLLRAAGLERAGLDGVVATRGPGSFTGVRVALATAQGLALALHIPAHGYSSLLAQAARTEVPECLAAQPARRGSAYAQPFVRRGTLVEALDDPRVVPLASLLESRLPVVAPTGLALPPGTPTAPAPIGPAEAILHLLIREPHPDPGTLTPLYLEPPPVVKPARTPIPWLPSPKAS
jgi:tRNA threonylcarbamoyl adenosine modification protein YeaZ